MVARMGQWTVFTILIALLPLAAMAAPRCVEDDVGREVCLEHPAQRIVGLSPGAVELLFSAGAGEQVVGAVGFSDEPPAARKVPRVGSYKRLDLEAILALKPDLVIAWRSGNPAGQTEQLERLGLTVYYSEPVRFEMIGTTLERFARLAGTEQLGKPVAEQFRAGIDALRQRHGDAKPITVFYQVWEEPLMTVNDRHLISEAIRLCGGVNVFGELPALTPRIGREAVLGADPEVIIAGGMGEDNPAWLDPWREFGSLTAVRRDNLFFVPPSTLQRPTPRMLEGTRRLCKHLEQARARR
ncbi:Fe3+-hydroxamate ABC transporter periplasmic binding protein [Alcanivorax xiamenensis]|uniref:Fe3+-hydroxamate ABC transporter periplasmic binding protein n=2 Tax=Alcanivorax TaxID=59753 RepID=A0ABQ6Y837_9GAMM|nr:cobalamin-binding protein [Alcanivorax xiamenensis]KAF0805723.1 Fe3+-hydroxamate ABC transporter periplasmic binding protein [Alcanivorax xiamenensis]